MATSPSHTLGEYIGTFFEDAMKSPIGEMCNKYGVYLDTIGERPVRKTKKITWDDINGSHHDLDYVIERNGSDTIQGEPIAFIELAWRRYTKHSKNKVQEIAGAVLPIAQKYQELAPFKGAILSGVFTENSLEQLRNQGFHVLYMPFERVVKTFQKHGLNIYFDETTSEKELTKIANKFKNCRTINTIKKDFVASNQDLIVPFMNDLESSLKRQINYIFVLPLHGKEQRFVSLNQAIEYLNDYKELPEDSIIDRYVVGIKFNNSSEINCMFKDKQMAMDFLKRNSLYY